jgi:hypothetical protein
VRDLFQPPFSYDFNSFVFVPKMFPGAIYKLVKPEVAMLIFETGSIMTLGVREYSDLKEALDHIKPILEKNSYPAGSAPTPKANGKEEKGAGKRGRNDPATRNMMAAVRAAYRVAQSGTEFRSLVESNFQLLQDGKTLPKNGVGYRSKKAKGEAAAVEAAAEDENPEEGEEEEVINVIELADMPDL